MDFPQWEAAVKELEKQLTRLPLAYREDIEDEALRRLEVVFAAAVPPEFTSLPGFVRGVLRYSVLTVSRRRRKLLPVEEAPRVAEQAFLDAPEQDDLRTLQRYLEQLPSRPLTEAQRQEAILWVSELRGYGVTRAESPDSTIRSRRLAVIRDFARFRRDQS